jgi:hypothetical protein
MDLQSRLPLKKAIGSKIKTALKVLTFGAIFSTPFKACLLCSDLLCSDLLCPIYTSGSGDSMPASKFL